MLPICVLPLAPIHSFSSYRIAQNFGSRRHWWIWRLGANSPKFYLPKFSITLVFYHCSTQSANVFSPKLIHFSCQSAKVFDRQSFVLFGSTIVRRIVDLNYHPTTSICTLYIIIQVFFSIKTYTWAWF